MSAKKFLFIYLIAMIPTYWWRLGFFGAMVDLRVNEGQRLTQSSQDSISLAISVLLLISYSIMFYACKKRGEAVGKNYLIVFPILGGVFDVLIPALFVPTICSLVAIVLGSIDSKSISHSISPTQVANQTDPVAETVYEQALDLSSDAYKIYLVKKYQIEKNHALTKFICRDRLFESIDQALQHAHELERRQKDNLEANTKNKQKRLELAKSLGVEEQDFGQGYKVSGQKFYDLDDAIAYAEQQIEREKKPHASLLITNKSASKSLESMVVESTADEKSLDKGSIAQNSYSGVPVGNSENSRGFYKEKRKLLIGLAVAVGIVLGFGLIAKLHQDSKGPHYVALDAWWKNDIKNEQIMKRMIRAARRADFIGANGFDRMYNYYSQPYGSKSEAEEVARSLNVILRENKIDDVRFFISKKPPIGEPGIDYIKLTVD